MKKILYYIFITVLIPVLLCQCTIKKKDTSAENNNDPHCVVDSTDTEQINRKIAYSLLNYNHRTKYITDGA